MCLEHARGVSRLYCGGELTIESREDPSLAGARADASGDDGQEAASRWSEWPQCLEGERFEADPVAESGVFRFFAVLGGH